MANLSEWLNESEAISNKTLSEFLNESNELDPSIPTARFESSDNRITRELTPTQKGLNAITKVLGGGGVGRPYKEDVTAQELEYENINPLYATYEAGKSLLGDVGALGSAAGGYATDIFTSSPYFPFNMGDREITPFMDRVAASNFFKPDITKKGQNYRQKFDENVPAVGGLNQLSALSRLKPVVNAPNQISTFKYNPANKIKQGVNVVKNEASDIA